MCLEAKCELSAEVGSLSESGGTSGLEVVWWQKVEPVGLTFGGNLDL